MSVTVTMLQVFHRLRRGAAEAKAQLLTLLVDTRYALLIVEPCSTAGADPLARGGARFHDDSREPTGNSPSWVLVPS